MTENSRRLTNAERELARLANKRVKARRAVVPPYLRNEPDPHDGWFAAPVAQADWEPWACMLLDAFGTRSINVANAFMTNLRDMCPEVVSGDIASKDPFAFEQAVAIVASLQPASEAEAAHAAAMVAVHFATMKVAADIGSRGYVDPRMAGTLSGLARTYTAQMQAMRSRKGPRSRAQVIKVQKNVTVNYDNRQVHLPPGGPENSIGQPHATEQLRAGARGAESTVERTALPCPDKSWNALPIASGERAQALPTSRVSEGLGRAKGTEERELPPRRVHAGSNQLTPGSCGTAEAGEGGER